MLPKFAASIYKQSCNSVSNRFRSEVKLTRRHISHVRVPDDFLTQAPARAIRMHARTLAACYVIYRYYIVYLFKLKKAAEDHKEIEVSW